MPGGLLQLIITGKQDIYLTHNPEITFFIKKFKKHTRFSKEYRKIYAEQDVQYNTDITFKMPNCDLLNKCFIEIEIPDYSFRDIEQINISKEEYINNKYDEINKLTKKKKNIESIYKNLSEYISIEIDLYRNISYLFDIDNIQIDDIKKESITFNQKNNYNKNLYINKIDKSIFEKIDMSSYLFTINKYISITEIKNKLDLFYKKMIMYLKYYNIKLQLIVNEINKLDYKYIKYSYNKYLGHIFIKEYSLNIGGNVIQSYTNDILHIKQLSTISIDGIDNYLEMIGHSEKLYSFNERKNKTTILIPLIFWFNNNTNMSLPVIGLKYDDININIKINNIENIINFEDHIEEYKILLNIEIMFDDVDKYFLNKNLIYKDFKIDYDIFKITYHCLYINEELLKLRFPNLTNNEINYILTDCGLLYTSDKLYNITNKQYREQYIIDKFHWVKLMKKIINVNNEINKQYKQFYYKFNLYYPYIDFNILYNTIKEPNISLIVEMIYLSNEERLNFTNSKLEYIVESYDENSFNIDNLNNFECYLSFSNPCKELYWYIQPNLYNFGLTEYTEKKSLIFDYNYYFKNNIIEKQKLYFENVEVLIDNLDKNYYTYCMSYKYLSNILPNGIYYKSFCLYPEESQPSGTINFRYFKNKFYTLTINREFKKEYNDLLTTIYGTTEKNSLKLKFVSKNYDLVVISNGKLNILFNL